MNDMLADLNNCSLSVCRLSGESLHRPDRALYTSAAIGGCCLTDLHVV